MALTLAISAILGCEDPPDQFFTPSTELTITPKVICPGEEIQFKCKATMRYEVLVEEGKTLASEEMKVTDIWFEVDIPGEDTARISLHTDGDNPQASHTYRGIDTGKSNDPTDDAYVWQIDFEMGPGNPAKFDYLLKRYYFDVMHGMATFNPGCFGTVSIKHTDSTSRWNAPNPFEGYAPGDREDFWVINANLVAEDVGLNETNETDFPGLVVPKDAYRRISMDGWLPDGPPGATITVEGDGGSVAFMQKVAEGQYVPLDPKQWTLPDTVNVQGAAITRVLIAEVEAGNAPPEILDIIYYINEGMPIPPELLDKMLKHAGKGKLPPIGWLIQLWAQNGGGARPGEVVDDELWQLIQQLGLGGRPGNGVALGLIRRRLQELINSGALHDLQGQLGDPYALAADAVLPPGSFWVKGLDGGESSAKLSIRAEGKNSTDELKVTVLEADVNLGQGDEDVWPGLVIPIGAAGRTPIQLNLKPAQLFQGQRPGGRARSIQLMSGLKVCDAQGNVISDLLWNDAEGDLTSAPQQVFIEGVNLGTSTIYFYGSINRAGVSQDNTSSDAHTDSAMVTVLGDPIWIHYNIDNDNNSDNSIPDADFPGADYEDVARPITNEDDLVALGDTLSLPHDYVGFVEMKMPSCVRAWSELGAQNLICDAGQTRIWELPSKRAEFDAFNGRIYIEGVADNRKGDILYFYRDKGNYPRGGYLKSYASVGAVCGVQPGTEPFSIPFLDKYGTHIADVTGNDHRQLIKNTFKKLIDCEWSIIKNFWTLQYNCIAFSVDETDKWYNKEDIDDLADNDNKYRVLSETYTDSNANGRFDFIDTNNNGYHDVGEIALETFVDGSGNGDMNGTFDVSDIDEFYRIKKNWRCFSTTTSEASARDAEAMYYDNFHGARASSCQCGLGHWIIYESKCGRGERLEHVWDQLNSPSYGVPIKFYK
ncbi:MAG TPA: hypothetical protein PL033_14555 [Candidatus Brocadiia bacterium]|nr:hypothetical protein [Candidatus Brocadiia bacterium]